MSTLTIFGKTKIGALLRAKLSRKKNNKSVKFCRTFRVGCTTGGGCVFATGVWLAPAGGDCLLTGGDGLTPEGGGCLSTRGACFAPRGGGCFFASGACPTHEGGVMGLLRFAFLFAARMSLCSSLNLFNIIDFDSIMNFIQSILTWSFGNFSPTVFVYWMFLDT